MSIVDSKYIELISNISNNGIESKSRNSSVKKINTYQIKFTTTPLVSVRKTAWKSALKEMEWFLSGSNNIEDLDNIVKPWWKPWANKRGVIKNNYSKQFRDFQGRFSSVDQIRYLIKNIKENPESRRHVITTWNTADMIHPSTPLTNCHGTVIQCFVRSDNLDLTMYQRSADVMLGVPHNWIQYWAFLQYICYHTNKVPGEFNWVGGDCHIYSEHYHMINKIKKENPFKINTPILTYKPSDDKFKAKDFTLVGEYKPILNEKLELIV